MTGMELWEIRKWIGSPCRGIVGRFPTVFEIINEGIKKNILTITPDHVEQFSEYVKNGKKIQTVKALRQIFGWSLRESKDYMDANWDRWMASIRS